MPITQQHGVVIEVLRLQLRAMLLDSAGMPGGQVADLSGPFLAQLRNRLLGVCMSLHCILVPPLEVMMGNAHVFLRDAEAALQKQVIASAASFAKSCRASDASCSNLLTSVSRSAEAATCPEHSWPSSLTSRRQRPTTARASRRGLPAATKAAPDDQALGHGPSGRARE